MSDTVVTNEPLIQTIELPASRSLEVGQTVAVYQTITSNEGDQALLVSDDATIQTVIASSSPITVVPEESVFMVSEGLQGPAGQGVPAGGAAGHVLAKNSSTNFDTSWGAVNLATQVTGNLPFANIADIASQRMLGRQSAGVGDIEELTAIQIRSLVGYQHGLSTAGETSINQSISASSTFFQTIALNSNSWTHGMLMVRDNNFGVNSGALVIFSTETNKAAGLCGNPIYTSSSTWVAGARVRLAITDAYLTDSVFTGGSGNYEMRIDSARINGANLEIVWRNTTIINRTVNARIRWYVWRGDQVNA